MRPNLKNSLCINRSLMYAQIFTRPDVSFDIDRYQSNVEMDYYKVAKKDHLLTEYKSNHLEMIGYLD